MLGHNDTRDQPLGQSGVASIVVAVLYFLGAAAIVANYRHTGFNYYRVLISSTLLRAVAFTVRAVYLLGPFKPALVGVFMALSNGGWGANVSGMCLVMACWAEHSKTKFYPLEHAIYKRNFYYWPVLLVLLGPSVGFIAAGMLYGTTSGRGEAIGQTLQAVASWAIVVVSAVLWLLLCRIAGAALMEEASDLADPAEEKHRQLLGDPAAHTDKPTKSENLLGILWVCASLALWRSVMGVVICVKPSLKYLYSNDHYYYALFQLPELLIAAILSTPTLLARISLVYPPPPEPSDVEASAAEGEAS